MIIPGAVLILAPAERLQLERQRLPRKDADPALAPDQDVRALIAIGRERLL